MGVAFPRTDRGVFFRNSKGLETDAVLLHCGKSSVIFEVYGPDRVAEVGETLPAITVSRAGGAGYSGAAVVSGVFSTGSVVIVTAELTGPWAPFDEARSIVGVAADARALVQDWAFTPSLVPSYQAAVANIRHFLLDLQRVVMPMDLAVGTPGMPEFDPRMEQLAEGIYYLVQPRMKALFDDFENAALSVPQSSVEAHRAFAQGELHPLILCAPLVYRTFTKPLGYAGDYEMVNMILRNRLDGPSAFARIVNAYFLRMDVAEGHRNRITKLVDILSREARERLSHGGSLRVLNLGCGPAEEVCRFIRRDELAERCEFTLLDFNLQTLDYARAQVNQAMRESGRRPTVEFVHKSVNDILKEAVRNGTSPAAAGYDLVYCAGLFDYLSDRVCAGLLRLFLNWIVPGGLVVATNVHPRHSAHATLDDLAEWRLILRTEEEMLALAPPGGEASVSAEPAGTNVFLEIRRPDAQDGRSLATERRSAPRRGLQGV